MTPVLMKLHFLGSAYFLHLYISLFLCEDLYGLLPKVLLYHYFSYLQAMVLACACAA